MTPISRRQFALSSAALLLPQLGFAQDAWPSRPISLIHGFGAGGNADVVSRLVGKKLGEGLAQPVVVDIKSGAGGSIATNFVAKAAPDGYTLVLLTGAHTVTGALRKNLPYDSVKDFAFISTVSTFPFVVAVRADHPAQNLGQLLELAKKQQVSFTSVGVGSTQHMVGELLASAGNVPLLHVPYRGGGAPVQAVIGGEVDILTDTLTVATPHIKSGRLKALAVTSAQEWPLLPGVTPASATLPNFEVRSWLGLAAPAGTPDAVIQRLNAETRKALDSDEIKKPLAAAGSLATYSTSAEMKQRVESEIARWRGVITQRGISVD